MGLLQMLIMTEKKYNFGSPSKMKGLSAGEKATVKFLDLPEQIETEEYGTKFVLPILLLSHPQYPSLSSKGTKMVWQTNCLVVRETVVPLVKEGDKEFLKDYLEITWEIRCEEDGSIWLSNA